MRRINKLENVTYIKVAEKQRQKYKSKHKEKYMWATLCYNDISSFKCQRIYNIWQKIQINNIFYIKGILEYL